ADPGARDPLLHAADVALERVELDQQRRRVDLGDMRADFRRGRDHGSLVAAPGSRCAEPARRRPGPRARRHRAPRGAGTSRLKYTSACMPGTSALESARSTSTSITSTSLSLRGPRVLIRLGPTT